MNTDDLIRAMASDTGTGTSPAPDRILPVVVLATTLLGGLVFLSAMGVRPDLAEALGRLPVLVKQLFPWVVAVAGLGLVLRLSRPAAPLGVWPAILAAVGGVIVLAVVAELVLLPPDAWAMAMRGKSAATCFTSIMAISFPVGAASLAVLRRGAPTRPALAGFVTGLMAGGAAAAVYAFYCNEDSPLFYGLWYVLAILSAGGLGALAGSRVLRW